MANPTCPYCFGVGVHSLDCPTDGTVAEVMRTAYNAASENVSDYWRRQRLRGLPYSLNGIQAAIDKAFGYGEDDV